MKNQTYIGGAFNLVKIMVIICVLALFASLTASATVVFLNGNSYTNANAAYNSGTNSSGVVTNNFQLGVVPGASNVLWQLSKTQSAQPYLGTNGYLPALTFSALGNFPNSLTAPTRNVSIELGGVLTATNATSTAVVFKFAASNSGVNWLTNYYSFTYTIPVNATNIATGCLLTNIDMGGTATLCLQEIDNPGVAALTNIVVNMTGKSGL